MPFAVAVSRKVKNSPRSIRSSSGRNSARCCCIERPRIERSLSVPFASSDSMRPPRHPRRRSATMTPQRNPVDSDKSRGAEAALENERPQAVKGKTVLKRERARIGKVEAALSVELSQSTRTKRSESDASDGGTQIVSLEFGNKQFEAEEDSTSAGNCSSMSSDEQAICRSTEVLGTTGAIVADASELESQLPVAASSGCVFSVISSVISYEDDEEVIMMLPHLCADTDHAAVVPARPTAPLPNHSRPCRFSNAGAWLMRLWQATDMESCNAMVRI